MKTRKILSAFLVCVMIVCAMSVTAFADEVFSFEELQDAINNAKDGEETEIVLGNDIVISGGNTVTGLSGEGTEASPYLIGNLEELKWFRDHVNTFAQDGSSQYQGKFIKLTADIDLKGEEWEPIGSCTADHGSFYGTFDGDGHTISNLNITKYGKNGAGFFSKVSGSGDGPRGTVKNLTIHNINIESQDYSYVGGVIANGGGNSCVSNVHVTGDVYIDGYGYVGGIVGHGYPDIDNCSVVTEDGSWIHSYYWCAGGIIGYAGEGGTIITNSSVKGIDVWSAYGGAAAVVGLLQDGNTLTNVSAENVEVTSASDYCMGYIAGNGEASTLTNVTVTNVTATANGNPITTTDAVASVGNKVYFSFAEALNAAVATKGGNVTVEILDNIDLTGETWTPVYFDSYSAANANTIVIEGNNKIITGLSDMMFSGVWTGDKLEIRNLTLDKANIVNDAADTENKGVGAFVGNVSAVKELVITNCKLTNSHVEGGHWTGGFVGYAAGYSGNDGPVFTEITVEGCSVENSTITGKGSVGGIVGHATGDAWTSFDVETTNITENTITSTGSSKNKAGIVMGTIGAAGTAQTTNGTTLTGGVKVAVTENGNTATSNGTAITTVYGRQGSATGVLAITGGTYENNPIEENVSYAAPAEGFEIVENEDGTYGVQEKTPELPTATVTKALVNTTVQAADFGDLNNVKDTPLTFQMNFKADEPTDEQRKYYSEWLADYELVINKDVRGVDGYLAGQYDAFFSHWIKLGADTEDVVLPANKPIKIIKDIMGLELEYEADILEWVKDFDCGIYLTPEFIEANQDLEITLALKLYNPENLEESYVIGEAYSFDADDLKEEEKFKSLLLAVTYSDTYTDTEGNDGAYKLHLFSAIDGLSYNEVGFDIYYNGEFMKNCPTNIVYRSVTTTLDGVPDTKILPTKLLEETGKYIFGYTLYFGSEWNNLGIDCVPYYIKKDGTKVPGYTFRVTDVYPEQ